MAHFCSTRSSGPDAAAAVARLEGASTATPAWAPPGYDEVDVRVLDWIASHRRGRQVRCSA